MGKSDMTLWRNLLIPARGECEKAIIAAEWRSLMSRKSGEAFGSLLVPYLHRMGQRVAHLATRSRARRAFN